MISLVRHDEPPNGRRSRKGSAAIRVHSIGFPQWATEKAVRAWLAEHELPRMVKKLDRGRSPTAKYAWARLENLNPTDSYRTTHWYTSAWGKVAVRYSIPRSRRQLRQAA